MQRHIGIDFGTTNSAVALATADGVKLAEFPSGGGTTSSFRSVLFFDPDVKTSIAGPLAIERYLEAAGVGRLLQSIKSYLPSRSFTSTMVEGRPYTLEVLVSLIIRDMRSGAESCFGALPPSAVVGRPVRFVGADTPEEETFALDRLRSALARSGFTDIVFEYEPVAAAYHYEAGLDHDELVLIGDFGGGTSDFCLVRVGPGARAREREILGTEGLGLAGDTFDSQIIRHLVAPRLGRGSLYTPHLGKPMPVPPWLYSRLERWHELSFLKERKTMQLIQNIAHGSEEPARIAAFVHLIEADLGYQLYRAVEQTKVELSQADESTFVFHDGPVSIKELVRRTDFERWIADQLLAIAVSVDRLLEKTGVAPRDVDAVFLTGGSSFVPAVRRVFETRFGRERLRSGGELTSVATGLALRARDLG